MACCKKCNKELYKYNQSGFCMKCIMADLDYQEKRRRGHWKMRENNPEFCSHLIKHIPPELRQTYKNIMKKGLKAKEVTEMLQAENAWAFHEHAKALAAQKKRKYDQERYTAYRIRVLPSQLEAARRKLHALENEARRLDMHDLLGEQTWD